MGYLRQVRTATPDAQVETTCLGVYERELDYLFTTLQRLGASPREIEDLAQEVFMILHRNWPTLDVTRPFRPYLFAVAFRVVCAHRRRRSREIPQTYLESEDPATVPEASRQRGRRVPSSCPRPPLPGGAGGAPWRPAPYWCSAPRAQAPPSTPAPPVRTRVTRHRPSALLGGREW